MKKVVTYITTLILSFLIFHGGAGINLVSYCCGDCSSAGIEVIKSDKCCEIHDHHHAEKEHACDHEEKSHHHHVIICSEHDCTGHLADINCCDLQRVDFEWDHTTSAVNQPVPVEMDLSLFGLPSLVLLTCLDKSEETETDQYVPPLIVCPRVYLSLLTTLLI